MSQVRAAWYAFTCCIILTASLTACSDQNDASLINPETGAHAAYWLPEDHSRAASSSLDACTDCHGSDLQGGISSVSCTSCHLGGVANIHPAEWLGDACSNHGSYALTNGTTGCANVYCHGASLGGVPHSGPSCTSCHPTIPTSPSCGTCHGVPPAGTAYPDSAGKHAAHLALGGVTCATCHNRSCNQHLNGTIDVIFDPSYHAKSGTGSFHAAGITCSGLSCHGGPRTQTLAQGQQNPPQSDPAQTPDWYTGTISVSDTNQCRLCHIYGTTEYNSYYSGKHYKHVVVDARPCSICHDTTKLSDSDIHFSSLASPVITAGTASATTWSWLNYNGTTCTYAACHSGETRAWW